MNKNKILGYVILVITIVLMSVIAFVLPTEKTNIFWITYAFTVIAYLAQILIWKTALGKAETLNSKFFGFHLTFLNLFF